MSTLPVPEPPFDADTAPYWSAAARGELLLPRCTECGIFVWYPRPQCPADLAPVEWVVASGLGVVHSYAVVHRGERGYAGAAPFVLAYVDLAEGPRMMTNVVGCVPQDVRIGMEVRVTFDRPDDAEVFAIPRFIPVETPAAAR